MKPRYVLHPGQGINAGKLAKLYRVRMADCVVWRPGMRLDGTGQTHLYPRPGGDYRLPGIEFPPITNRKEI